jgi:hypothetical protein
MAALYSAAERPIAAPQMKILVLCLEVAMGMSNPGDHFVGLALGAGARE